MLEIIRKGVRIKIENIIMPQYKYIVFCHSKYYVQSLSPYLKKM